MLSEIEKMETEFEFFKQMAIGKLQDQELDGPCMERIMDQIYWVGHFVGRCRERMYRGDFE